MDFNYEQVEAIRLIRAGHNVFLSGPAGTGKTSIVLEAIKEMGFVVLLAPTGIAALNFNGQTIHSFAKLPTGLLHHSTIPTITNNQFRMMLGIVKTIIIDEISMVRADLFVALDLRLREAALELGMDCWNKPWAGKQIVVLGDFFQLPPVLATTEEELYVKSLWNGPFAFLTPEWEASKFITVNLTKVHRQRDPLMLSILNHIRIGDVDTRDILLPGSEPMTAIEALNHLCFRPDRHEYRGPVLCTTKTRANEVNSHYLEILGTEQHEFHGKILGKFLKNEFPTEEILSLQEGQRVMALNNYRVDGGVFLYVNGDCGTISQIYYDEEGQGHVKVDFDNAPSVEMEPFEWKSYTYATEFYNGRQVIRRIQTGSFRQLPLRPAYAFTIHKAQGLTLDAGMVDCGSGCFAPGQLYTAISRCRSLENLYLARPIRREDVRVAPEVLSFYGGSSGFRKRTGSMPSSSWTQHELPRGTSGLYLA